MIRPSDSGGGAGCMTAGRDDRHAAITATIAAIEAAERDGLLVDRRAEGLSGISGLATVALLQRLVAARKDTADACYVEIGVFQGLTLVSVALAAPRLPCIGIDDFSILDPAGENLGVVRKRLAAFDVANARLVNADYEAALASFAHHGEGRRIAVYFVDGAHDYRSQLMGLMLGLPWLADDAVVVVDDANYAFVRRATDDFLTIHPDWRLLFDAYSPGHPANLDRPALARFETGWLNGIHVLVRDPAGLLPDMRPPLAADRGLYVNDWLVHRHGLADLAPEALTLAAAVLADSPAEEHRATTVLAARRAALAHRIDRRFPDRNTDSAGLPERRFNRP